MKYYYDESLGKRRWRMQASIVLFILVVGAGGITGGLRLRHRITPQLQQNVPLINRATPKPSSTEPQTSTLTWAAPAAAEDPLLALTNQERTKAGVAVLSWSSQLSQSATAKCKDMVTNNYWSHIDITGREPWHFIDATGYKKQAAGENLAYGFTSNQAVVEGWMNSPAHRKTLLEPIYTDVGFGVCESPDFVGNGKQTIVVQHLATPLP